ncbi:MAG: hypothetical protein RLY86_3188 [Pseudomonadota bacterium]|jgi:uncharacterized membrane protein
MLWLKLVHVPAILVWAAGLLVMPFFLTAHRKASDGRDFVRVRRAGRFIHTAVMSPAGVLAVLSGTLLLFPAGAIQDWMFLKLTLVMGLVVAHLLYGRVLTRLADPTHAPALPRVAVPLGLAAACAAGILWLVLAKPSIPLDALPAELLRPGVGQELLSWDTPTPCSKTS